MYGIAKKYSGRYIYDYRDLTYACIPLADWNNIFNVSSLLVENFILVKCVRIVFIGIMLQIVLKIITSILYAYQRSAIVNVLALFTNILILLFLLVLPSKSISENLLMMSWVNVVAANVPYIICSIVVFSTMLKGTIGNGMSYFKLQMIWMTFAGIIFIPLAYILVQITRSWIAVVLANVLAMLPYEVLAPIFTIKKLKNKIEE